MNPTRAPRGALLAPVAPMPDPSNDPSAVPPHVAETLETIAKLHKQTEREVPRHQRSIETVTALLGQPSTVFVLAGGAILWVFLNILLSRLGVRPPDPPPFAWLQASSSVGALLMAAMVLSTQNRQRRSADERERLELHVNLLAEQKLAKLISLIEELRRDMPNVVNRVDPLADAMTQAVDPNAVAHALKHTLDDVAEAADERADS
jgi:uncharacterized membrane protein